MFNIYIYIYTYIYIYIVVFLIILKVMPNVVLVNFICHLNIYGRLNIYVYVVDQIRVFHALTIRSLWMEDMLDFFFFK